MLSFPGKSYTGKPSFWDLHSNFPLMYDADISSGGRGEGPFAFDYQELLGTEPV